MLTSTAASCAAVVLWLPRPVEPQELPALRLDPAAVAAVLNEESRLESPEGPQVEAMEQLFKEQGEGETQGDTDQRLQDRGRRLQTAVSELVEAEGEEAVIRLRASVVNRLDELLEGEGEEAALLGSFPRILSRYAAASEGKLRAPRFVVRTLYKARWNVIFRRQATDGFADVEKQAYWGWLALHAGAPGEHCPDCGADLALRTEALRNFARSGGAGAREAAGVFAFRNGRPDEASQIFGDLYDETGVMRYRNYALAALVAMQ